MARTTDSYSPLFRTIFAGVWSIVLLGFLWASAPLFAANDSHGRDFRLAFPPNFHDMPTDNTDSLYIYIASDTPTQGQITWKNSDGVEFTHVFVIDNPADVYTFSVSAEGVELQGFNRNGFIPNFFEQNEEPVNQSFHITTDTDVTVYALNQASRSSDAFLVLPTDALGQYYSILSYNSDGNNTGGRLQGYSTPSQFVVVATQDGTDVTITPSQPTWEGGRAIQHITLNAGECYLVQAYLSDVVLTTDLTGTRIAASKPVSVIAGHQRATVPVEMSGMLRSRDCLLEQLPPIEAWGYSAIAVPYPIPYGVINQGNDLVRVLALYDSTVVAINGTVQTVLDGGAYYETALTQAMVITSPSPVLVAQYKKTSRMESPGQNNNTGDPFMMLIPPSEQFLKSYRFVNAQVRTAIPEPPLFLPVVFQEQYCTLVVPERYIPTLRLDGAPVSSSLFIAIPGTDMSYAFLPMTDGSHSVSCDTTFGLYVYGYGNADSYGYTGGMNMEYIPKDLTPPVIMAESVCRILQGTTTDSLATDSGIRSIELSAENSSNATLVASVPPGYPQTATFTVRLVDPYHDGYASIVVHDSARFRSEHTYTLHGYTVEATVPNSQRRFIRDTTRIRKEICFDLTVNNYGTTSQTITAASFVDPDRFTWASGLPLELHPGESRSIQVCFKSDSAGVYLDTLVIQDACTSRAVIAFAIHAVNDTVRPAAASVIDPCERTLQATVSELLPSDWGIMSVRIVDQHNSTLTIDSSGLPLILRYTAATVDPRKDAIVTLLVVDEAGNERYARDTIQGFTIHLPSVQQIIESTLAGTGTTDSIPVSNTGLLPFRLTSAYNLHNTTFSLPLSQFPLVIEPQQTRYLQIVFAPAHANTYTDTLVLRHNCLSDSTALVAQGIALVRTVLGNCNSIVRLDDGQKPERAVLLTAFPNPADAWTTLRFALPEAEELTVRLYTPAGQLAAEIALRPNTAGIYEMEIDTSFLDSGVYIAVVHSASLHEMRTLLVTH